MTNPKSAFTRSRLRNVLCSLFFVVAGIAALGEIGSWHAIAQHAGESVSPEDDSWGQMDISAATVPTPPPCNGQLITILDESFDDVTPPDLPIFGRPSMGSIPMAFCGKVRIPDCRARPMIRHLMQRGSMIRL